MKGQWAEESASHIIPCLSKPLCNKIQPQAASGPSSHAYRGVWPRPSLDSCLIREGKKKKTSKFHLWENSACPLRSTRPSKTAEMLENAGRGVLKGAALFPHRVGKTTA